MKRTTWIAVGCSAALLIGAAPSGAWLDSFFILAMGFGLSSVVGMADRVGIGPRTGWTERTRRHCFFIAAVFALGFAAMAWNWGALRVSSLGAVCFNFLLLLMGQALPLPPRPPRKRDRLGVRRA